MKSYERLLLENKAWAAEKVEDDPNYFTRLSNLQTPEFLWIGCSDSRVPANEITGTEPGEIFVQRNIANMVIHTDLNLLSVLQYAVEVLEVKHIIVCGHYGCGGVRAAMTGVNFGLLNKWIRSIKDVFARNQRELEAISDNEERLDLLVEKNVREQVINLAKTSIVQKAWFQEQRPQVHGWVFDLRTGMIKELLTVSSLECLPEIYHYKTEQFG